MLIAARSPAVRSWVLAALLLSTLAAGPIRADDDGAKPSDPVLAGVLELLEAEMSEPIVVQWLEAQARMPRLPSAEDLVLLQQAGASDELLALILKKAQSRPVPRPDLRPPSARPSPSAPAPSPKPEPAEPTEPAEPEAPKSGTASVTFDLDYSPYVLDGEEEWQLYLYLDGKPLSYVPSSGLLGKELRFTRSLSAGKHTIRVTQELHTERKRKPMEHRARVADLEIPLDLEPGKNAVVEIRVRQTVLSSKDPISYRVTQGRQTDVREDLGGDPDRWREICEDIELSLEPGEKPSRGEARRLKKCVRWADLWPAAHATERERVLEAMSRFEYRPIPREQELH